MRIPTSHYFTRALVRRFGLKLATFQQGGPQSHIFAQGEKAKKAVIVKSDLGRMHFSSAYHLPPNETTTGDGIMEVMERLFMTPMDQMHGIGWREFVRKYDRKSLRDHLHEVRFSPQILQEKNNDFFLKKTLQHGTSDQLAALMGLVLNNRAIFDVNFVEFVIDECLFMSDLDMIVGGKDLLPRGFLPYLKDNIQFNVRAHAVKYGADGVHVK